MNPGAKTDSNVAAKDRLIEAGIDVFGEYSYEAATTRMIAGRAGVNIAAIPYYFNGKEGLYHAVIEHIVGQLRSFVRPTLKSIGERAAQADLTASEAISLVETLLGKMVDFMVGAPEAARFAQIVLREHLYPSPAYEIIFNRVMTPIINGIAAMIAAATGQPITDAMRLRALAFMGQVMAFRVARETMVRALGFTGYSAEETLTIRRLVLEQTRGAIESITRT
jgi:TetR/AcrR family transcriptional regulator, regulator of cefoperazone and chloramphenicol sensitivity